MISQIFVPLLENGCDEVVEGGAGRRAENGAVNGIGVRVSGVVSGVGAGTGHRRRRRRNAYGSRRSRRGSRAIAAVADVINLMTRGSERKGVQTITDQ